MKSTKGILFAIAIAALSASTGCDRIQTSSIAVGAGTYPMPESAEPAGYAFETAVRIKAGDEFVSVESPGYACPTMADVDGDGKQDLIVGQFNQGHMLLCRNVAADGESPKFASVDWIKSGDDRAIVPGVW
jgi:hypothetical protein